MKPRRKIKEGTVMIRRYCRTLRFLGSAGLVIALAAALLSGVVGVASASDPQVWTTMATSFPHPAYLLEVVAGANGKIYAIGGWNSVARNWVSEYSPPSDSWLNKMPMFSPRSSAGVAESAGLIYVIGGIGGGTYTNTVEAYNPATNTWSWLAPMSVSRDLLAAAASNGKIYALGGRTSHVPFILKSTVEEYDPGSNTWTTKSPMSTARHYFAAVAANGKIYAIGGFGGLSPDYLHLTDILNTMEEYDPVGDRWTQSCMPGPRGAPVATAAPDGKIYVIGGYDASGVLNSVVRYDPLTKIWESGTTPTPIARFGGGAAAMADGKIYVMGGLQTTVEEYNPAADTWVVTPSDPTCGPPPDSTPPTTTDNAPSAWQKADFTVTLTCADNDGGSGCKETKYRLDGGAWQTGNSISISTEGDHLIEYYSIDNAGNQESAESTHAKLDKTPPTATYSGNAGTYTIDQMVSITCTATDNLSGVAFTTCANISGAAYTFTLGTNSFSASATDQAGNTGTGSTSFTVQVTTAGLGNLVMQFVTKAGVANSMISKLNAAEAAAARGNAQAKAGAIGAFINELQAQAGKSLTAAQAATLIALAQAL